MDFDQTLKMLILNFIETPDYNYIRSPDFGQNLTEPISANNNTIGKGIPRGAE